MTAEVTSGLRANGPLLTLLCVLAMLVTSLCLSSRSPVASGPTARISMQQLFSSRGAPPIPNRPCSHGGLSQSFGTCASAGVAGLDQAATGHTAPVELQSSRIAIAVDSIAAIFLRSRLERPPRF
jgi:hypothetical protein